MPAPLIYINAFPGVGKLTISRCLQTLITWPSRILDNHTLIDPVEAHTPRTSPAYQSQRQHYRRRRLREVATDPSTLYIFTDAQTAYTDCMADYFALALPPRGRRIYTVILECGVEENVRRLTRPERRDAAKGKLRDPEVLRAWREREGLRIWRAGGEDEIVVDVTDLPPGLVAERVWEFVRGREEGRGEG